MNEVVSIKLVTFDGKKSNWPNFERKFKAFTTAKKLKGIFKAGLTIPKAGEEKDASSGPIDEKLKLQVLNKLVYNMLLLAMDSSKDTGQVAFDLVTSTESAAYPVVNFILAWKKLCMKYSPTTVTSMKEVEKKFNGMQLKKSKDMEFYFGKLQVLRLRLNTTWSKAITDEKLILRAATGLPKEYQPVTFLLMLICAIRYNGLYLLMDVEMAFLLGKLEEEIYMECLEGLEHQDDEILLLLQTIYSLVQSAI